MITIQDLEMRFGPKGLFKGVDLQLMPGNRYGLVGANGSGKSTFLKLLAGEESPVGGSIQHPNKARIGLLRQDHFRYDNTSLMDTVLDGRPRLIAAMKEMEELLCREDFSEAEGEKVGHLETEIAELGGYSSEADAAILLEGLGLPAERHGEPMKQLSGGYKLRVLLAQTLFSEPDVLYLDEPTNHLDIYSIQWLEGYLKKFDGVLVVISHDRDFINGVSTHILDVDYGDILCYKGNYDAYLRQVAEERERRESAVEKTERRRGELQGFVDKFRAKASKARQAQSKVRMIEKLDKEIQAEANQPTSRRNLPLGFRQTRPSGAIALKVEGVSKAYGEKKVLEEVSFEVERGDSIAILGPNGIGKSTLLKVLAEGLEPESGEFQWGHGVSVSYFPQDIEGEVRGEGTALQWIHQQCPGKDDGYLRKQLARALFSGDDSGKSIGTLSGGERARLILARMMAEEANVLIFDEPTNHLDIEAIESLSQAMESFEGTVLLVSHNRWFISRLASKVLEILPGEVRLHEGGYEEMLEKGDDHLERKGRERKTLNNEELKVLRQKERDLQKQVDRIERDIQKAEHELSKLNEKMVAEGFFDEANAKVRDTSLEKAKGLEDQLEALNLSWEKTGEELQRAQDELG